MRFLSRIKRLELELRAQSPPGLAVVPVPFGESQEEARARYCEQKGISEEEAGKMSWIFVQKFWDGKTDYTSPVKAAHPARESETPLAPEPKPAPTAPQEHRPLRGNGGERRGALLLRPPEELRADDLVGLMNKRRRH